MRTRSASLLEKRTREFCFVIGFSAFAVIALVPGFAANGPAKGKLEDHLKQLEYEAIPFEFSDDNQPVIHGEISGGKKPIFLLDTGCSMTRLKTKNGAQLKTLGELGVELEDKRFGRLTNTSIVLMDKLTLGRARFLNQPAQVEKLEMDFISVRFGGILGCDFFLRNFCLIDCGARRLYARAADRSAKQSELLEAALRRSGFVEAASRSEQAIMIDSKVNGRPVRLLVDTGSFRSILDESQIDRLSLAILQGEQPWVGTRMREDVNWHIVGMGKIGAHPMRFTKLQTFEIGSSKWQHFHFGVANLKSWRLSDSERPDEDVMGILGMDFLGSLGALIDFSSLKLWLRPDPKQWH